ncbi:MAG: sigma-54-dependent Fis family transcriptional regulator, partial [Persephonella sp.]
MMSILVVDDERNITELLKDILEDEGYDVDVAYSLKEAKEKIKSNVFDVALIDVWLPDGEGLDLIPFIKKQIPKTKIVMISGHANIPVAVKALKEGAFDFLEKPISIDSLLSTVERAYRELKKDIEYKFLKEKEFKDIEIIGESEPIQNLKKQIEKVAKTNAWVMILGENGTGKELVAKSI